MSNHSTKGGSMESAHVIGSRQRKPSESTYGLPNHDDGIQSGNLNGDEVDDGGTLKGGNTEASGPGATHSNGMAGQK